jgi:hypothetical protein
MPLPTTTPEVMASIGYGDAAIGRTVSEIVRVITNSTTDSRVNFYIRKWAELIIAGVAAHDHAGECRAVYDFVARNVRYVNDPYGYEWLQTPFQLLQEIERSESPSGDCDDLTTLGLSLLKSIGYQTQLKVTGYLPDARFTHIYGLVDVEGTGVWTAFDATKPDGRFGDEAPSPTRTWIVPVP